MASHDAAAGPVANIKVVSPAPQITTPLDFALPLGFTVRQLKERIMEMVEGRPDVTQQRLIYRGKFLKDEESIGGILGASANGEDQETSDSYTFHLALRPSRPSPVAGASIRKGMASLFPDQPLNLNSNTNTAVNTTVPTPTPTTATTTDPVPSSITNISDSDRVAAIERQRQSIQEAIGNVRQRLDRINDLTTLVSSATRTAPPPAVVTRVETRVDYTPSQEGGARMTRTTHTRTTTASMRLSTRVGGVRTGTTPPVNVGGSSGASSSLDNGARVGGVQGQVVGNISAFNTPNLNNIIASLQSGAAAGAGTPSLYLLQGPEGQCLLLAGPPSSTPSTSLPADPPSSTQISSEGHPVIQRVGLDGYLPGESPTDTFSSDTSLLGLEGITSESLAQLLNPASYGLAQPGSVSGTPSIRRTAAATGANSAALAVQEVLAQERTRLQAIRDGLQAARQHRRGHRHHQQNQPRQHLRQVNLGDVVRRIQDGGAHVWLAVRLVVFVVIFSGGAGWRRRILLGLFAAVIFVWQTGLLEGRIRAARALYRELFPPQVQVNMQQVQPGNLNPTQANLPPDPAATAQLLVQRDNLRRQTRLREAYEMVERVAGLFVASLVPGVGEQRVRAHEERERLRGGGNPVAAAAAEEERRRERQREIDDAQRGIEDAGGAFLAAGL